MKKILSIIILSILLVFFFSCEKKKGISQSKTEKTAKDILGNPEYLAISYGGYRENTRDVQPTIDQLKEDMKIISAMNVKILRTFNTKFEQVSNLLEAISQLKKEESNFEMYVMLGAWIDCENAWDWSGKGPNHEKGNVEANTAEIERVINLANKYPNIVKIVSVGNEAMVHWATGYFVKPRIILKWVNHLQNLKKEGKLPKDLWITSSDNFASWGGHTKDYHTEDLEKLIKAVDYVSVHTYPFHDTHHNPEFWVLPNEEQGLTKIEKIDSAMLRARNYAISQYQSVVNYMKSLGVEKPIHIGETGWASYTIGQFGDEGTRATDEYKQGLYYKYMRDWTNSAGISCFYFETFDEKWKDPEHTTGSENNFGLIKLNGKAKYPIWELVDQGVFDGLTRDGNPITKTFNGNKENLVKTILAPLTAEEFEKIKKNYN